MSVSVLFAPRTCLIPYPLQVCLSGLSGFLQHLGAKKQPLSPALEAKMEKTPVATVTSPGPQQMGRQLTQTLQSSRARKVRNLVSLKYQADSWPGKPL